MINALFQRPLSRAASALVAPLLAATCALAPVHAAVISLAGDLSAHNAQVRVAFSTSAPGSVSLRTSSWNHGVNIDPMLTLFDASGQLVDSNDDDALSPFDPLGNYDARIDATLGAGSWLLVLTAAPNSANGSHLADGFAYDAEAPIDIATWDQPSFDPNTPDSQKGRQWALSLSGVDSAHTVPEPTTLALVVAGLLAALRLARRNRSI